MELDTSAHTCLSVLGGAGDRVKMEREFGEQIIIKRYLHEGERGFKLL